jgi:hypothetical protein
MVTVTDASGTRANGTAATGLWMDVNIKGTLFTGLDGYAGTAVSTRWFGEAVYHLQSDGAFSGPDADKQVLVNTGQGYVAQINHVLALNLCAWGCPTYGVPFDLGLGYNPTMAMSLTGYSRDAFSHGGAVSFAIAFRSTDSAADLRVSSLGGFTQPVPEPETYAMLLAGLGLVSFAARARRERQSA